MSKATEKEVKQTEAQTADTTAATQEPPKKKAFEITLVDMCVEEGMERMFVNQLRANTERLPIVVYLTTCGGDPKMARFIMDMLETENLPTTIIGGSLVASAGTILMNTPNALRLCYYNSAFIYHFGVQIGIASSQEEWDSQSDRYDEITKDMRSVYETHIGLDPKFVKKNLLSSLDKHYNGAEVLELGTKGAVDGIILFHHGNHVYDIRTRTGIHRVDLINDDVSKFRVTEPTEFIPNVSAELEVPAKK